MTIVTNEIVKVICKKTTLLVLLTFTVLNGVLLYVNYNSKSNESYTIKQYNSLCDDISDMSDKQKSDWLNDQIENIYLYRIGELTNTSEDEVLKYTGSYALEEQLYAQVLEEVNNCLYYDDFLDNIDNEAKRMTGISLFAEPDSFSYRNIQKTPESFSHLKGIKLIFDKSSGIKNAVEFLPTDIIGIMMILYVCILLITREKEQQQLNILKSTYNGRYPLIRAKLITALISCLLIEILLYGVNFAFTFFTSGFGDLNRYIQSVYGYQNSSLKITVMQYFVLFLFAKLAVFVLISIIIILFAVISKSAVQLYIEISVFFGIEAVCYASIGATSWLSPLKYINIVSFLNTYSLFASYKNLNFFEYPINYIPVFIVTLAILIPIFAVVSAITFVRQKAVANENRITVSVKKLFANAPMPKMYQSVSLFWQESYKLLIGGKILLILCAFAAALYFTYQPIRENFGSVNTVYYKNYMLELQGELTPEKETFLTNERERFDELTQQAISADGLSEILSIQKELEPQYAFIDVEKQADYIRSTDNGWFVYDSGYKLLTGDESAENKDAQLAIIALAVEIACLAYVYSVEYQNGAASIVRTTFKGRRRLFLTKLLISVLIISVIYLLTYGSYFYNVLHTFGTRAIDAPACSLQCLSNVPSGISILQYLIIISIVRYIGMAAAMLLIFLISSRVKSYISALLVSTAVMILPLILYMLGLDFFKWVLLSQIMLGNI